MDEKKAIKALKAGNTDALEWLIEKYAGYINTIVYNIIGHVMTSADIEEVASDVFLALWDNAGKINANQVKAYLGSIARNKAKNKLRELDASLSLEDDIIVVSDSTPEIEILAREEHRLVREAILTMGNPDKEIFLRHYYYYQNLSKISEQMGMNISTVKTRLARGRQQLKRILSEGGGHQWKNG